VSRFTTVLLTYLSYLAHLPAPLLHWHRHLPRRAAGARDGGRVRGGAPPLGWPLPLHPPLFGYAAAAAAMEDPEAGSDVDWGGRVEEELTRWV
jgi:hypothetical protein